MKWPSELILMRHGQSTYNVLREQSAKDKVYQAFVNSFTSNHKSIKTKILARVVRNRYSIDAGDWDTPLTNTGRDQSMLTGRELKRRNEPLPDVVYVSPYLRTQQTFNMLKKGWPELGEVEVVYEERIREQEHGLQSLHNNWRVFYALNPEQKELRDREGSYWYQHPQGENVPMVRERVKDWLGTLIRENTNQKVFVITHHLTILTVRASLERWDCFNFIEHDENDKPLNCGLTTYKGIPEEGKNGKLILNKYNEKLY